MDCIVHGVAKSRTRLSDFHFFTFIETTCSGVPVNIIDINTKQHHC